MAGYEMLPIGVVRSQWTERSPAPRQAAAAPEARGRIELDPGRGFEDALEGLDGWDYAWVLFVFHRNVEQGRGWRPKVRPPRAERKVGVFATRSPHRPNPLGLSAVRVERVEGLVVHVRELDLLDGTPVLDLKPYVPYADARPDARSGWLGATDPGDRWSVSFDADAAARLAWLEARGEPLRGRVEASLALGPQPHAYRRIRARGDALELAVKAWRVDFEARDRLLVVRGVRSGHRAADLASPSTPELLLHAEFAARFGP